MSSILIVDDDDRMRDLLRARLEELYQIIDTGDPQQALALALKHKPEAILLDLMMPNFSGFELCRTFTSLSFTQRIPIFVVSGEAAAKYRTLCQDLGATEYFEKPVDFNALKVRLAAVMQAKPRENRSEVRVRLRVVLKLRGTDVDGKPFEIPTSTDNVSRSGFLCGCTVSLQKDAEVEVYLVNDGEQYVGRARAVRDEGRGTPCPRYGFRFVEKSGQWVLQ
jgi:DNA-binding response OmpR family regulator